MEMQFAAPAASACKHEVYVKRNGVLDYLFFQTPDDMKGFRGRLDKLTQYAIQGKHRITGEHDRLIDPMEHPEYNECYNYHFDKRKDTDDCKNGPAPAVPAEEAGALEVPCSGNRS